MLVLQASELDSLTTASGLSPAPYCDTDLCRKLVFPLPPLALTKKSLPERSVAVDSKLERFLSSWGLLAEVLPPRSVTDAICGCRRSCSRDEDREGSGRDAGRAGTLAVSVNGLVLVVVAVLIFISGFTIGTKRDEVCFCASFLCNFLKPAGECADWSLRGVRELRIAGTRGGAACLEYTAASASSTMRVASSAGSIFSVACSFHFAKCKPKASKASPSLLLLCILSGLIPIDPVAGLFYRVWLGNVVVIRSNASVYNHYRECGLTRKQNAQTRKEQAMGHGFKPQAVAEKAGRKAGRQAGRAVKCVRVGRGGDSKR